MKVDVLTARNGALNAALAAIQVVGALFPSEEWGEDITDAERRCVELLDAIQRDIDLIKALPTINAS